MALASHCPTKNCSEIIRYLKAEGKYVLFNSNATLLNASWQQALIESQLDEYRVSLDATTPESYAVVRGKPLFPLILNNLEAFMTLKRRLGAANPRVSLWLTGLRETLTELPDFLRIAHRLGIEEVYLQRLVYWHDDNNDKLATATNRCFRSRSSMKQRLFKPARSWPSNWACASRPPAPPLQARASTRQLTQGQGRAARAPLDGDVHHRQWCGVPVLHRAVQCREFALNHPSAMPLRNRWQASGTMRPISAFVACC